MIETFSKGLKNPKQTNKQTNDKKGVLRTDYNSDPHWTNTVANIYVCHLIKSSYREIHFYSNRDSLILSGKQYFVHWR